MATTKARSSRKSGTSTKATRVAKSSNAAKTSRTTKVAKTAKTAKVAKKAARATRKKPTRTAGTTRTGGKATASASKSGKPARGASGWPTAYAFEIPMSRATLEKVVADIEPLRSLRSSYLTFFYLPVEERIGEWRFAGTTRNLAAAIEQIGIYENTMFARPEDRALEPVEGMLEGDVLEIGSPETVWGDNPERTFQDSLVEKLPPYRLIVYALGGAPHDHLGFAIVEVRDLGRYARRKPDTRRPEEWPPEGEEDF